MALEISSGVVAKENTRPRLANGVYLAIRQYLVPHHGCAEEAQHLIDRIGDGIGAAAGEEQTDRARISCDILHHQRSRVAAVQETAVSVRNHNLTRERLGESGTAGAFS